MASTMMSPREAQLTQEVELLREKTRLLEQENNLLRGKVDALIKRLFGASSEKLDANQLLLLLQGDDGPKKAEASSASCAALEAELDKPTPGQSKPKKKRCAGQPRVPDHLPTVDEVIDPQEISARPQDWRCIGQEVTELLDFEPGRFLRRRLIRRKYVRRNASQEPPVIAPLNTLQERCIAAPGLLAQIITTKYCDHLPLFRQECIYATRHDVKLPRQSLCRWLKLAVKWLQPVYDQIKAEVLATGYVQMDETHIDYLSPGHGQTKTGQLWACGNPQGGVFYSWQLGRGANCVANILPVDFGGHVQSDGYAAYGSHAAQSEGSITLLGCWAHARRYFVEAKDEAPKHAGLILLQIRHLYAVEARLREQRAGPRMCEAVRQQESVPILQRLRRMIEVMSRNERFTPKSAMGQALTYALNQWERLVVHVEDGRLQIDNNRIENAMRPAALGRKNWLFIGEAEAGHHTAVCLTIIENCRRWGLNAFEYLRDLLGRLPTMTNRQIKDVTPAAVAGKLPRQRPLAA
jgi:transposase